MNANQHEQRDFTASAIDADHDTLTPQAVARRAYLYYERSGSQDGSVLDHWLTAKAELLAERENF